MVVKFTSNKNQILSAEANAKRRVLDKLGAVAEGYAVKLCPVDTGRLRNSITHDKYDEDTEIVGSNVEYAPFVELGHYTTSGKKVAAQPFIRPAIENHRAEYIQIIRSELG